MDQVLDIRPVGVGYGYRYDCQAGWRRPGGVRWRAERRTGGNSIAPGVHTGAPSKRWSRDGQYPGPPRCSFVWVRRGQRIQGG